MMQHLAGQEFFKTMLAVKPGEAGAGPDDLPADIDPPRAGLGTSPAEQTFGEYILEDRGRLLILHHPRQVILAPGAVLFLTTAGLIDRADYRTGPALRTSYLFIFDDRYL